MLLALFVFVLVLAVYVGSVFVANRFIVSPAEEAVSVFNACAAHPYREPAAIRLMSWNLGYAGMGKESDFIKDGGKQRRPLSRALVQRNLSKILGFLGENPADIYLFQEVARSSSINRSVDVHKALAGLLDRCESVCSPDIRTRLVPPPLAAVIGNTTFSRFHIDRAERRMLPQEPEFVLGFVRNNYRMLISRLAIPNRRQEWVIVNIHLAAFDSEAKVRKEQLRAIREYAVAEYEKGNLVVIGGDWNLRLAATSFPHETPERYLFWVHDLPEGSLPDGWKHYVDAGTPTVRTAHKPYIEGENYVCVIDGFLCSPNVAVEQVETADLRFSFTDHHPVFLTARPAIRQDRPGRL